MRLYPLFTMIMICFFCGCIEPVDYSNAFSACQSVDDAYLSYVCFRDIANISGDFGVCDTLAKNRTDCYVYLIHNMNESFNETICDEIDDVDDGSDKCFAAVAVVNENPDLCDIITTQPVKDSCYSDIARSINDPALCPLVQDVDNCYLDVALRNNNPIVCDVISSDEGKDYCLFHIMERFNAYGFCDNLSDSDMMDRCHLESVLNDDEFSADDFFVCDSLTSDIRRNRCLEFAMSLPHGLELCENIPDYYDDIVLNDMCYYYLAIERNDVDTCGRLSDNTSLFTRYSCLFEIEYSMISDNNDMLFSVAVETNNSSVCGEISGYGFYELMDECLYMVALNTLDPRICENISIGAYQDISVSNCLADIAYEKKDYRICLDRSCNRPINQVQIGVCEIETDFCLLNFASKMAESEQSSM